MGRGGLARHIKMRPYGRNGRVRRNANLNNLTKVSTPTPVSWSVPGIRRVGFEGDVIGRMVVVQHLLDMPPDKEIWLLRCECGQESSMDIRRVKRDKITNCGCVARRQAESIKNPLIDPFAAQHAEYETITVLRRGEIVSCVGEETWNRNSSVVDSWFYYDGDIWKSWNIRTIERARDLWRQIGNSGHFTFQRSSSFGFVNANDGCRRKLNSISRHFSAWKWRIFENVVRWDEPTGVLGSKLCDPSVVSIEAAKAIVREVSDGLAFGGYL